MNRRLLPLLIFGYIAVSFALDPSSPIRTHHLADPDDFMRLHQVANWLQGQSWFDTSVPRLSLGYEPPTIVHWSRLVDLPIAALAFPFLASFGLQGALLTASFLAPLAWLALFLFLLPRTARPLLGERAAWLAPLFLLFAPFLLFDLSPGRVDHHGPQATLALCGLIGLSGLLRNERPMAAALLASAAIAGGFWIGPESWVWVLVLVAAASAGGAVLDGAAARNVARFGLFLPLFVVAALFAALPAPALSDRALSWFSPAYALFAALAALPLIALPLLARLSARPVMRLTLTALLGTLAAAFFLALVPAARIGPFADYASFNANAGLATINEAQPLLRALRPHAANATQILAMLLTFFKLLFLPLIALTTTLVAARKASGAARALWLAQAAWLGFALGLALFWQQRVLLFAQLFMLIPLACAAEAALSALRRRLQGRPLFAAEIALFLALGPLPVVLLPAFAASQPVFPVLAFFPAERAAPVCDLDPVIMFLNDPQGLGERPATLLNVGDQGPEILFRTRHAVVSGNYDAPGNADAFAFLSAKDETAARAAAARTRADYVLVCKRAPALYLGRDYYAVGHARLRPDNDGQLRLFNDEPDQPMIQRLIRGPAPGWLKPIEIPGGSDYFLFALPPINRTSSP